MNMQVTKSRTCACGRACVWMTHWRRCVECLIFAGYVPQKRPEISGSFAERDLQLKASYAPSPPSTMRRMRMCVCNELYMWMCVYKSNAYTNTHSRIDIRTHTQTHIYADVHTHAHTTPCDFQNVCIDMYRSCAIPRSVHMAHMYMYSCLSFHEYFVSHTNHSKKKYCTDSRLHSSLNVILHVWAWLTQHYTHSTLCYSPNVIYIQYPAMTHSMVYTHSLRYYIFGHVSLYVITQYSIIS